MYEEFSGRMERMRKVVEDVGPTLYTIIIAGVCGGVCQVMGVYWGR